MKNRGRRFFTLTELLVALAAVAVLSAIGIGVYSAAAQSAKNSAAKSLFAQLNLALENGKDRFGYYPKGKTPGEFNEIRFHLENGVINEISFQGNETGDVPHDFIKDFMKNTDGENWKKLSGADDDGWYILSDPWGNPVYYACPGKFNSSKFDLYSAGADGMIGQADQNQRIPDDENKLNNLKRKNSGSGNWLYDNGELSCDDVVNF